MFAPPLRRRWRRRGASRGGLPFKPIFASTRSAIRSALHRTFGPTVLARPALALLSLWGRFNGDGLRRVEIDVRLLGELHAQLIAQHPRADFHDLALGQITEFERTERHADQAVDRQTQALEDLLDLAVLALPEAQGEPGVCALLAVKLGLDSEIVDALDRDAAGKPVERRLVDVPVGAYAIAA